MIDINSTLLHIKALADWSPYEGEREAAAKKLREIMDRHGITEQDLDDSQMSTYKFKHRNKREEALLIQVAYKVLGTDSFKQYQFRRNGRIVPNLSGIMCTIAQRAEIEFLFDFYRELYYREEDKLYDAFVQKHKIFGTSSKDKDDQPKLSSEELINMELIMRALSSETPHKRIEGFKSAE